MRRAVVTLLATVVGLVLLLSYKTHGNARLLRPSALGPASPGTSGATPAPQPSSSPGSSSGTRTLTGQPVDTQYGVVQVQVTVSGGRITGVKPLQLPDTLGRDIEIDNIAVPELVQETLQAQSAQIDSISGATFTSEGYAQSLQSALDQMHG